MAQTGRGAAGRGWDGDGLKLYRDWGLSEKRGRRAELGCGRVSSVQGYSGGVSWVGTGWMDLDRHEQHGMGWDGF